MITDLPFYVVVIFVVTTLFTAVFFLKIIASSRPDRRMPIWALLLLVSWMALQAILGWQGFYRAYDAVPPHMPLVILPPLLLISYCFIAHRQAIQNLSLRKMTFLHTVRIPVELVLFWLAHHHHVPTLMTYEGRNFDILAGITAPIIGQIAFRSGYVHKRLLLSWNILSLLSLINIVTHAILSMPLPFQQFAFDQPNIGVFYFPFIWLPSVIVPAVLFCHLAAIYQLRHQDEN